MYDFNSPLDQQKPATAQAVSFIFGGLLVVISAITSAAFFFRFAGEAFVFLVGDLSPWLSAVVGVLCFEVASLTWAWLRAHDADTQAQLAVSNLASWLTMAGGLAVTVIYFGLTSSLVSTRLDSTAETVLSLLGALLIVAGIAGNFAAAHVYRINGATHASASQSAELAAMQHTAAHAANREATLATLQRTLETIRAQLPETADRQGVQNAERYIAHNFRTADQAHPTARSNGQRG